MPTLHLPDAGQKFTLLNPLLITILILFTSCQEEKVGFNKLEIPLVGDNQNFEVLEDNSISFSANKIKNTDIKSDQLALMLKRIEY